MYKKKKKKKLLIMGFFVYYSVPSMMLNMSHCHDECKEAKI